MKKMIFGLCALFACFVMVSCGNSKDKSEDTAIDPESLIEDAEKMIDKAEDIESADDFVSLAKEMYNLQIEFYKAEPTMDEAKDFERTVSKIQTALFESARSLDVDEQKEFQELEEDKALKVEMENLEDELKEVREKWEDKQREKDEDEE